MTIKILSPQLANQIAAGEVVERPASVVKELVENSLDAGADKIQIDIETGGATLIRVRDNGCGIPKNELCLALARHATSKIADLEDLEAILSLGFRGEALASMSSVSRLTLTSRTAEQNEAWQVYAQGREMEAVLKPASHPVGTTVEVANLFFNTPARRKFLRSDKTEFAHIDEVIRRIALAKFNIAFTLTHNGKIVRQYRAAQAQPQQLKRVAAICGDAFVQHALRIDWLHDDLHLSGWVATPDYYRSQNNLAYCYINGRMVRDKVVVHAIRQAYAPYLNAEQYPAFVLFLDLPPQEVDVNVHPTKHEVRFHQQRLIHDFICQGVMNALADESPAGSPDLLSDRLNEPMPHYSAQTLTSAIKTPQNTLQIVQTKPNRAAAGRNIFASSERISAFPTEATKLSENRPHFSAMTAPQHSPLKPRTDLLQKARQAYHAPIVDHSAQETHSPFAVGEPGHLRVLALVENQALLLQKQTQFYLLSLAKLQHLHWRFSLQQPQIATQPLLIPLVFRLNHVQFQQWQQQKSFFRQVGFDFTENSAGQRLTLTKVPSLLRSQNLQQCLISLFEQAQTYTDFTEFLTALCARLELKNMSVLADAINLLNETERQLDHAGREAFNNLLNPIDWAPFLAEL